MDNLMVKKIISQLSGIDKEDLTTAEINIAKVLIDFGLAKWEKEDIGIFLKEV